MHKGNYGSFKNMLIMERLYMEERKYQQIEQFINLICMTVMCPWIELRRDYSWYSCVKVSDDLNLKPSLH